MEDHLSKKTKLGVVPGVYIPVCLNILSILMFLRFGVIIGQIGFVGIFGLLVISYAVDFVTTLSLSAIASNGVVKGGGAYYLISRSLGPEFGGSIGILFYLAQVLNTALNVVGLISCIQMNARNVLPDPEENFWGCYLMQTAALVLCTLLCLAGSGLFAKASNALLIVLMAAIVSIPVSAFFRPSFQDPERDIYYTGASLATFAKNMLPTTDSPSFHGFETFRNLFGILFPATSGIFAGASMSGDLRNPSKAIPKGTLWAMLSTFVLYLIVILALSSSITTESLLKDENVIQDTSIWPPIILAGECAATFFSALMGVIGSAKLLQALARDKLLPGLAIFGQGTRHGDEPIFAIFITYLVAQVAMLAELNQIATFISMGYQMTFFVMNLACFLLKIGSAPNFRPAFKFFNWQSAFIGAILSAAAMFLIDETYAAVAVCTLIALFILIHYLSPPKKWGDVSQNLIYHQVRKYLLRLKPEHIKFWRPQIILLINDAKHNTRLIQFCNSMKKGSLYILGHVIVTEDFTTGVQEAKKQHEAWQEYINTYSRIKAFVQLNMSPSLVWGVRNLILSAGLGGMRPNIAVIGFYNIDELRNKSPHLNIPTSPTAFKMQEMPRRTRKRGDTSAKIMRMQLPTDWNKMEDSVPVTAYLEIIEDLALRYRLNVAVAKGFTELETPRGDGSNTKKYIDLWPVQMSAEILSEGKNILTTNFDTYTLILQLGFILRSVPAWKKVYKLRVMAFVEYEGEVDEEHARVKALLEKLRIDAEVKVFWLACGQIQTYESIIHGNCHSPETERIVDQCLRDEEWWDELREFRGKPVTEATSKDLISLAQALEAGSVWGNVGQHQVHGLDDSMRRRYSVTDVAELPKRPTVSRLSRMGVNVGIHTQNLPDEMLESDSDAGSARSDSELSAPDGDHDADFNDSDREGSDADIEIDETRPLLIIPPRRKSYAGDVAPRPSLMQRHVERRLRHPEDSDTTMINYGSTSLIALPTQDTLRTQPPAPRRTPLATTQSATSPVPQSPAREGPPTPGPVQRPPLSRQTSAVKFSSKPMPETTVNVEGPGPTIWFKDTVPTAAGARRPGISRQNSEGAERRPALSRQSSAGANDSLTIAKRPGLSRQSSSNRFSSRPMPEARVTSVEGAQPTISFAEPDHDSRTPPRSRHHSRKNSAYGKVPSDAATLNIPELLENYKFEAKDDGGSTYSTQSMPLSFNDLPSRAQHLILNELIKKESSDAAVIFTTLPIPEEGISQSETDSIQYLSDIEVLCHELPPVLLVLSNNMTVTVSL